MGSRTAMNSSGSQDRYPAIMTKWPPPPDHPIRAPSGRSPRISARICAIVAAPPDQLARLPVLVSALSKYHGWLHCAVEPFWQHVDCPSSALTTEHCVHPLALS